MSGSGCRGGPRGGRLVLALGLAALLQACIYVPRTTGVYDPECQIVAKQMVLDVVQVGSIQGCSNEGCIALVVAAGVTATASAIVSGSIAVVGNVVYWMERQGQCRKVQARTPG